MTKFIKNLTAITIPTLVVVFLLLEVFFRVAIPATSWPYGCFDTEEKLFKFCPNGGEGVATFGKFAQQRGRWRVNNSGWNSPVDYSAEKDKPRIAVIGDSYIEAFHVDTDKSYPSLLRSELGGRYDVYSFGISGAALSEYLNLSRYVNRNFDPDVLIFNVRYNDFLESIYEVNPVDTHMMMLSITDGSVTETVPRPNYSFTEFSFKKRLLRKSAIVRYLTLNLKLQQAVRGLLSRKTYSGNVEITSVERHTGLVEKAASYVFERIEEENRGRRVIVVMGAPKHDIYAGTTDQSKVLFFNRLVAKLCSNHGFELLDLTEPMKRDYETNHTMFNSPWDGHWNEYGHEFVSRQVLSLGFQ
ncbi:MAG: hypothetical protein JSW58_04355 [Candidatus Latescibacterota bacterium]|nr:MAG: hypothetical protein JSW58_04355 [Candidatus Latescibacterota bacterium]